MNKYSIQGTAVAFLDAEPHSEEEARAYLQHARNQGGDLRRTRPREARDGGRP